MRNDSRAGHSALIPALAAAALAACAATPTTSASAIGAPVRTDGLADITIAIEAERPEGDLYVSLFRGADAYGGGAPVAGRVVPARPSPAVVVFEGVEPGRYAVKMFHDLDGDGEMDANVLGIPSEPYAFSNNAPASFGPPGFEKAAFEVPAGASVVQEIKIK